MKNKSLILVPLIVFLLLAVGCKSKSTVMINQKVENTSQINFKKLIESKNSYVGDNNAVGLIVSQLPANIYSHGFELSTNKSPYAITINYEPNQKLGIKNYNEFWSQAKPEEFLEKNAILLFSLISNTEVVTFKVQGIGEESYVYTREEVEQKYGDSFKNLLNDENTFKTFFDNN